MGRNILILLDFHNYKFNKETENIDTLISSIGYSIAKEHPFILSSDSELDYFDITSRVTEPLRYIVGLALLTDNPERFLRSVDDCYEDFRARMKTSSPSAESGAL